MNIQLITLPSISILPFNNSLGYFSVIPEIKDEDIPQLSKYADKEANPLYPVPKLMNAKELSVFYNKLKG